MIATSSPCRKGTVTPSSAVTASGPLVNRRLTPRVSMAREGMTVLRVGSAGGTASDVADQQPPLVRQDDALSLNQPPT